MCTICVLYVFACDVSVRDHYSTVHIPLEQSSQHTGVDTGKARSVPQLAALSHSVTNIIQYSICILINTVFISLAG